MRIAYLSDTHLDFHGDYGKCFLKTLDVPECDLLVIAGDLADISIVDPTKAFETFCDKAPKVLVVLGNHDYYHSSFYETEKKVRKIASRFPTLKVVDKAEEFETNGVKFLAGTLWFQDYPDQDRYKKFLNDFYKIKDLEPEVYQRNKRFDVMLHGIKDEPCVVISHHMPSSRCVNYRFSGSAINRYFVGGEFNEAIEDSKISYWICGHSHDRIGLTIGNTKIISNPLGYPYEVEYGWKVRTINV